MTNAFPAHWRETNVGSVFDVVGGSTPRTTEKAYWDGSIPWITPEDLAGHSGKLIAAGRRQITQAGYDSCSTHMLPEGSVLFSSRAPIGHVAIAANELCTNQGFKSLVPRKDILPEFTYWYLTHATVQIRNMGSGTTFAEISKKRMQAVPFPLVPLWEQKGIVEAIEENFSHLDSAETELESALERLEDLRRAILHQAFNNPTWPRVPLSSLGVEVRGQIQPQPGKLFDLYSVPAFPTGQPERTDGSTIRSGKRPVEPSDVLICKINPRINRVWVVGARGPRDQIASTEYLVLRLHDRSAAPFLSLYLSAPEFRRWIKHSVEGVTGSHTRAKSKPILEQRVPYPSSTVRSQVAGQVVEQLSGVNALMAEIPGLLHGLAGLRRGVLASAFSGTLV